MPAQKKHFLPAILFLFLFSVLSCTRSDPTVFLITGASPDAPVEYGLEKLEAALSDQGYLVERAAARGSADGQWTIFAGLASEDGPAKTELAARNVDLPAGVESLVIHKDSSTLLLCGTDPNGLMYALLEAADRIGWREGSEDLFHHVKSISESPEVADRSLSIYTMHRKSWEDRLYDENYWEKYFDRLAQSRINSFVVIFGYENGGFLAPAYPYFFDVDDFPEVRLTGITPEEQQRNVDAFKRMIALAHERGIRFMPGIWDHIYRGGVQSGGVPDMDEVPPEPIAGLVWGLHADNLAGYTKAALKKFLDTFPEIDGIQFRMHWESGLTREETPGFWGEVFDMLEQEKPSLHIDLRTKGLPDEVIQDAIAKKLNFRLTTKYWMEQLGLPFHPVHINTQNQHDRRHGYADLLTYPQHYRMHWRLWNGGTSRILLWGDPEYVRRFVASTKVYDGNSFEVNEPLATKMEAQPHDMEPFDLLNPAYRYYDYEFERYWYFFQLWGRLGYNPNADPAIFDHAFMQHFGTEAGPPLQRGLHLASRVLPRIIASAYRYRFFPTTRGWVEKMRMEDLPEFAQVEGSDIQLFANFSEEAEWRLSGGESPKVRPGQTAGWLLSVADSILAQVEKVETTKTAPDDKELTSTVADLKILAYLAQYYGRRIPAAVYYNIYRQTEDIAALDQAIEYEQQAIESWNRLVKAAGDIYADNLRMGICHGNMCGHWRDELEKLRTGVADLRQLHDSLTSNLSQQDLRIFHVPVTRAEAGAPLTIRASVLGQGEVTAVRCVFRTGAGAFGNFTMNPLTDGQYEASIHLDDPPAQLGYLIEVETGSGQTLTYPSESGKRTIPLLVRKETDPPRLTLQPVERAVPGQPLRISVRASDASGVKWIQLRYRHLTQFEDYNTLRMEYDETKDLYTAEIPGAFITPKWNLMYFVEAMDTQGNGRMYPDFEKEMPYVIVKVDRTGGS
jgi:hypothetical protein